MITTDQSKCIHCNKCILVCPFTVIQEIDGYPKLVENKFCVRCLHCVAICPEDALIYSRGEKSSQQGELISAPCTEPPLSADFDKQLTRHIKTRRSIRRYKDAPVARDIIEDMLETVKMTPSAKNQHPCRFIIVNGKEKVEHIMQMVLRYVKESGVSPEILSEYEAGNNCVTMNAPSLLIACANTNAVNPFADSVITLTSAELLLQAKGVGTCWAGYLSRIANADDEIKTYIQLPRGTQIYGILTMGYAKEVETYLKVPYRADVKTTWI